MKSVFECKMCGFCCYGEGGIVVTDEEIIRIAKFLNIEKTEFIKKFLKKNGEKFYIKEKDNICLFFKENIGCTIHPVKPDICRAWPFLRGNMVDRNSFEMAKRYCPGINPKASFEKFLKEGKKILMEKGLFNKNKTFLID